MKKKSKAKKSPVHLTNEVRKLCKKLGRDGFNGVCFHQVYLESENETAKDYAGELTAKQFAAFRRDYAIFIADPDFDAEMMRDDNRYLSVDVDRSGFEGDFREMLHEKLGNDLKINYTRNCAEWEIIRIGGALDSRESDNEQGAK